MLGLFPPERAATTHPSLVRAAVKLLRDAGAQVTVGDNCGVGGYGLNQLVAKRTGIMEAADGAYANVAQDTVMHPLKSRFVKELPMARAILEADHVVSLPKMKTHSLTVVTGAVKNMFGMVSGAGKGGAHRAAPGIKDFGEILADIYAARPPDLTIMDGITAMEGSGPSGGDLVPLGRILAGRNAVAVDAVMSRIMGYPPGEVHHLRIASQRGLGPLDQDAIELIGSLPSVRRFKLPRTVQRLRFVGRFVNQRVFRLLTDTHLHLDQDKCQGCRICVDGCPTGAMQMGERFPAVDENVCIKCFCCQELCPESAWEARGFFGRFLRERRF
jgi:uncharacterized protein (DUF362 family)/Pyruvate/2-oxoacid:ferredoxin oxidoreductase delta subunit